MNGISSNTRLGWPRSTVTNNRHMTIALMASSSPKMAISRIGFQL